MTLVIQVIVVLVVAFNISFIQTDSSSGESTDRDGMSTKQFRRSLRRQFMVEEMLAEIQNEVYNIKRHFKNVNDEHEKELRQIKQNQENVIPSFNGTLLEMQEQQNRSFRQELVKTKNLIKEELMQAVVEEIQKNDGIAKRLSRRSMEILEILGEMRSEVYNFKRHQRNVNNEHGNEMKQIKQENVLLRTKLQEMQQDHDNFRNQKQLLDMQEEQNGSFWEEMNKTKNSIKKELMQAVIEEIRTHFQTKDCGPAPDVNNSISTITNTNAGQAATYRCMDGFRLGGSPAIVFCQHNGSWSDVLFFCDKDSVHQGISALRLAGNSSSGRVEVLYTGIWGTICDDGWDDSDATVVCKEIGFRSGTAKHGGHFGQGRGQVWIGNVDCNGTETKLDDCQFGEWGNLHCGHNQDAGVICFN